jgi:hypothetical protein
MGISMHTLTFPGHLAILDPVTGIGVLVLPAPADDEDHPECRPADFAGVPDVQRFFSLPVGEDYANLMQQLASIGWELPADDRGYPAWLDAGATACCGRTMIMLYGERTDPQPSKHDLAASCKQQLKLAAAACSQSCRPSPVHTPRPTPPLPQQAAEASR